MKIFNLFARNKRVQTPSITRSEALACIPEKSAAIRWQAGENGDILIEYPLDLKPFFLGIAKKINRGEEQQLTKKLQLDTTGSRIWLLMDGKTDVKTIIKNVAPEIGLSLQETELSVTTFLRELGRRGLIILKKSK